MDQTEFKQHKAREILKNKIISVCGSVHQLSKETGINHTSLYRFLNNEDKQLGEKVAQKLLEFCKKRKLKVTMKQLRPHITYY